MFGCRTLGRRRHPGHRQPRSADPGPNLDQRQESYEDACAIQSGGFSGAMMSQNIVVGKEPEEVAKFVREYAGQEAQNSPRPGQRRHAAGTLSAPRDA